MKPEPSDRSKNAAVEAAKVTAVLDTFDAVLNLDHHYAKVAGEIDVSLKLNPIEDSDLLIASIALANQETLLTRNSKHFLKECQDWQSRAGRISKI